MRVLVLDNYDSFTFNLVQYLGELGAEPTVVRNDQLDSEQAARLGPERLVVSPGPGTPQEAGHSIDYIPAVLKRNTGVGGVPGTSGDRGRLRGPR